MNPTSEGGEVRKRRDGSQGRMLPCLEDSRCGPVSKASDWVPSSNSTGQVTTISERCAYYKYKRWKIKMFKSTVEPKNTKTDINPYIRCCRIYFQMVSTIRNTIKSNFWNLQSLPKNVYALEEKKYLYKYFNKYQTLTPGKPIALSTYMFGFSGCLNKFSVKISIQGFLFLEGRMHFWQALYIKHLCKC